MKHTVRFSWIWALLITGFVLGSFAPAVYEMSRARDLPAERQFELVHNFYTDYNFYLSRIREGLRGQTTVTEKYTSEPHRGSFIHELYLLMGWVGRVVRVPEGRAGDVYHVARLVLAAALLSLIAAFARSGFGAKRTWALAAFLLAVTASSWPKLVAVVGTEVVPATWANLPAWRFGGYMSWWSVMDSLQRITFIPHLLAGQALMVFLIMASTNESVMQRSGNAVFLGILGFLLGMILPPALLFVYGTILVYGILRAVSERRIRWNDWMQWAAFVIISSPSLLYLALMTSVYPWKRLTELDVLHPLPFAYGEYFKAVGPVLPLGILGSAAVLFRRQRLLYPAAAWVVAWFIFLGVFRFIPQQSPLRFSEMIPEVPLAVLGVYFLAGMRSIRPWKYAGHILGGVLILLGLLQMYSSYLWQRDFVDHKIIATVPLVPTGSYVMYPLKDFYAAILYLEERTSRDAVVVSGTTAGNYIPVYSGNTVYVGHDNTVDAEAKKALVSRFYRGGMTPAEAQSWLRSIPSRVVFFGPQEREEGGLTDLTQAYPFLVPTYANTFVTIYTAP